MLTDTCFLCPNPMARSTAIRLAGPVGGRQQTITLHPACAVKFAEQILAAFSANLRVDYATAHRISDHAPLCPSERRVLSGIVRGLTNAQIAEELHLAHHTVKNYCYTMFEKLHVTSRAQAAIYALQHDLLETDR